MKTNLNFKKNFFSSVEISWGTKDHKLFTIKKKLIIEFI